MDIFDNDTKTRSAFHPTTPAVSEDGSISAFKISDTSAIRALETLVEPGTIIDGFEVGRLVGRGGIAAVYEGVQLETEREVALKILDARFSSSADVVAKFLAEGQTLSGFDHPNIVHYVGHGRDEVFVYIAMELVKGITLDQLIYAIPLEKHHYLHLAREISKGLTRIHAEGVVHGDIKPSNILVTRSGEVKISDFGTAARMSAAGTARGAGNKVSGTSAYMAPELFDREKNVDYRADIYSLGVTFYKVFTGSLPSDPWVAPSQVNPALPAKLDSILLRALQRKPDDRYVTVKEFADALAALLDENAIATPVAITPDRATVEAREAQVRQPALADKEVSAGQKQSVDWKLVILCGLAAIGIAAVVVAGAIYFRL